MNQTTLTDADRAILSRLKLPALRNESRADDNVDFRAMLAIECHAEREWRINGRAVTPADCIGVQGYANGRNLNLREKYELAHGEAFA